MKAITTKYIPPTNTKPALIKAKAKGVAPLIMSYSTAEDLAGNRGGTEAAHKAAALALRDRMDWAGDLIGGGLPDQSGYCFVFALPENAIIRNLESQVKVQAKIIKSLEVESAELVYTMENVLNESIHVPGDIEGNKARTTAARIIGGPRAALARAREAIEKAKAAKGE
jgi:hypothetical protein